MEGYRKSQSEVKRLTRALVETSTLLDITLRKLKRCKNELVEEKRKYSRKRSHVSNPNCKVVRAVRVATLGPHSLVQQMDPDPTSNPIMGSK